MPKIVDLNEFYRYLPREDKKTFQLELTARSGFPGVVISINDIRFPGEEGAEKPEDVPEGAYSNLEVSWEIVQQPEEFNAADEKQKARFQRTISRILNHIIMVALGNAIQEAERIVKQAEESDSDKTEE